MIYLDIPYVKNPVSKVIYGLASQPFLSGGDGSELLDAAYECGISTFDVARGYGYAENSLGKWIAERDNREDITIISKCAHPSADWTKRVNEAEIRRDFEESSRALNTDYIDIYLLHRDDTDVEAGEIVEIFNALHSEGRIGAFGGSNWTHERIETANEYAYKNNLIPFTASSPNFGLAEQVADPWGGGCISISGPSNVNARKWYRENDMPVLAYSSLGRGLLSGRVKSSDVDRLDEVLDDVAIKGYVSAGNIERLRRCEQLACEKKCSVSQIAMAWMFAQDLKVCAILSTSKAERIMENVRALYIRLTEDELAFLDLCDSDR